jgi:multidrug efflux pump subunit AcrB
MKILNFTLNDLTLLALALVVGILVDDAIVEIENIERHMHMGKTPYRAALDASDEIGLAVVATTFTIVAVFGPVAFMTGITGQFFRPFGLTVAASVLFSLLVARMVTPLMAAYLMKDIHQESAHTHGADKDSTAIRKDRLSYQYRRLLNWALQHRVITLAIALIFFIASLLLVPYIPVGLFSTSNVDLSIVAMELPPGSTIEDSDRASQKLTTLLLKHPAVDSVQTSEQVKSATLYVKLKPRGERKITRRQFEQEIRPLFQQIPGARLSSSQWSPSGGGRELAIVLKSENPATLIQAANELEKGMHQIPGLVEITSSASLVKPEILITPDPVRAADQGVTVQQIARTANLATLGDFDANLAKFDLPDRQIPIRVQLDPKFHTNIDTIRNLQIQTQSGALVPLETVATISLGNGPSQIDRYNRYRKISVEANLQGLALGNAVVKVNELPILKNLPPSVVQEKFGNAKIMGQVFVNFGGALLAAVVFIYAVLALLFNDFLHPLTIMVALPFSIGGALLGLLITQKELSIIALIGIFLLMGLVTKNSILLVDYALLNQREGKAMHHAVVDSGVARLRPILMTTIAMIAGMIPIALGIGAGSESRSPMAIAVIGGLMTSTMLTLLVVPVIFTYIDRAQEFLFGVLLQGTASRRQADYAGNGHEPIPSHPASPPGRVSTTK